MQNHDDEISNHEDEYTSETSFGDLCVVVDVADESTDPASY